MPNKWEDPCCILFQLPSHSSITLQLLNGTMMRNSLCFVEETVVQPHRSPCQLSLPSLWLYLFIIPLTHVPAQFCLQTLGTCIMLKLLNFSSFTYFCHNLVCPTLLSFILFFSDFVFDFFLAMWVHFGCCVVCYFSFSQQTCLCIFKDIFLVKKEGTFSHLFFLDFWYSYKSHHQEEQSPKHYISDNFSRKDQFQIYNFSQSKLHQKALNHYSYPNRQQEQYHMISMLNRQ